MTPLTATLISMTPILLFLLICFLCDKYVDRERKLILAGKKKPWGMRKK